MKKIKKLLKKLSELLKELGKGAAYAINR